MATLTVDRWRHRFTRALPWLRWIAVATASATILSAAPPLPSVRLATTPALAIAIFQLARLTRFAIHQPHADREADDRLQVLVDRTCVPGVELVEVYASDQVSAAGQRALTVELRTGSCRTCWFPQAHFEPGSLVLIEDCRHGARPVAWMQPHEIRAAYRHRARLLKAASRHDHKLERELSASLQFL